MPTAAPTSSLRRLLPALLAVAVAVAALIAAGCGGSGGGSADADPAKVAPKSSLVYVSAFVRPQGSQKDAVNSIAKKVLGVDDPGKRIQGLLDQGIKKSGSKLSYKDDVKPWLGNRAALAVTSIGASGSRSQVALIIASKDNGKANDAVKKAADENKPAMSKRSYQGVDYRYSSKDNSAAGVVKDYVVFGTEAGFKAVVDASKGGSLTDNAQYKSASAQAPDKLAFGFVDTRSLVSSLGAQGQIPGGGQSLQSLLGAAGQPVTFSLAAAAAKVTLEAVATATGQAAQTPPSQLLTSLPGDSWLALGLPNVGNAIRKSLAQLGGGIGAGIVETASQQLRAQTGLDLQRDILPTFGELAVFARGSGLLTAGGGVVIKPQSPAAARRVLAKLPALIRRAAASSGSAGARVSSASIAGASGLKVTSRGLPGSINAVLKGDRLVIAYTDEATREALSPHSKLGDSPDFQHASATLGGGVPALYLAFAPVAQLASAGSPQSAAQIQRYLGAFTTLVAGSEVKGGKQVGRVVVNLK